MEKWQISVFDIPWEDVLFPRVFSFLNYEELLNFQAAFTEYNSIVNIYLSQIKTIDWTIRTPEALNAICEKTSSVRELDFSCCRWLSDKLIKQAIKNNKYLTTLNICNCPNLTISGVQPIVNLKNLISLSVRRNIWVTNSFVDLLTTHLEQLEEIDLGMCKVDDSSLVPFFSKCRRLEKIDLEAIPFVSNLTLNVIANNCPDLQTLNLCGNKLIGDDSLRFLVSSCSKLCSIRVFGCENLSGDFLTGIREEIYCDII